MTIRESSVLILGCTAAILAAVAGLGWLAAEIIWAWKARACRQPDEIIAYYADGRVVRGGPEDRRPSGPNDPLARQI